MASYLQMNTFVALELNLHWYKRQAQCSLLLLTTYSNSLWNKPNHIITDDYYRYLLYGNAEKPGPSVPGAGQKYNQSPLPLEVHVTLKGSSHH